MCVELVGVLFGLGDGRVFLYGCQSAIATEYQHNLNELRVAASVEAGGEIGPEGSIGRLSCTLNLTRTSKVVSALLGTKLIADTGEWGTYAWAEQVLGAPGYRIAGGSEEIQHNIIGERVLGLPREPR